MKNSYGKDAFAVVKTEKDLLGAVLREGRPAILETLEMWEAEQQAARIMGDGARGGGAVGGAGDSEGGSSLIDKANAEGAQDAGPVALQLEMASEAAGESAAGGGAAAAKALKKKSKKKGSGVSKAGKTGKKKKAKKKKG